jgi:hypothetical protein
MNSSRSSAFVKLGQQMQIIVSHRAVYPLIGQLSHQIEDSAPLKEKNYKNFVSFLFK